MNDGWIDFSFLIGEVKKIEDEKYYVSGRSWVKVRLFLVDYFAKWSVEVDENMEKILSIRLDIDNDLNYTIWNDLISFEQDFTEIFKDKLLKSIKKERLKVVTGGWE